MCDANANYQRRRAALFACRACGRAQSLPSSQVDVPATLKLCRISFAYVFSTTVTRVTLPLRSKPSCTRVPGRTMCGSTALPDLSTNRTRLPSSYETGLVSGEDCTTMGEAGSMGLWPGLNAVTVPILTAPSVICVGAFCTWPVCPTPPELFATLCANAKGAMIAQTNATMIH